MLIFYLCFSFHLFLSLLSESMLTGGLELRIVIIIVIVVGILLLMVLLCYLYHRRNKAGIKGELVYLHWLCIGFVILEAKLSKCITRIPFMKWSVNVSHLKSNLLWYESLEHQQGPRDWARYYRRSWVVQCPPPLLPEGGGRCQGEGQRRSQPDPGGARLFPVRQARPPSSRRQWVIGETQHLLVKRRSRCDEAFVKTRLK